MNPAATVEAEDVRREKLILLSDAAKYAARRNIGAAEKQVADAIVVFMAVEIHRGVAANKRKGSCHDSH